MYDRIQLKSLISRNCTIYYIILDLGEIFQYYNADCFDRRLVTVLIIIPYNYLHIRHTYMYKLLLKSFKIQKKAQCRPH